MQYSFKTKRLILQCRKIFLIKTQNFYIEKVLYVKQPKTVNLCNDFSGYSKNCNNIYTLSSFAHNNYHHQEAVDRSTDTVYFSLSYQLTHIFQNHNTLYLFYYFLAQSQYRSTTLVFQQLADCYMTKDLLYIYRTSMQRTYYTFVRNDNYCNLVSTTFVTMAVMTNEAWGT